MRKEKSIIYVNYSPYENAGRILDYLLEKFDNVFLFSIGFHKLGRKKIFNKLTFFHKGKIKEEKFFYHFVAPENLVYYLIPIRSFLNISQIFFRSIKLWIQHGKVDVFFTVNAFNTMVGMVLQKLGVVKKNVFWVWDYYPLNHPNLIIRLIRTVYWELDKLATKADRVVYLNSRLAKVRKTAGVIPKRSKVVTFPIGVGDLEPKKGKDKKKIRIGFLGVLKKSQGIDMLFDSARTLSEDLGKVSFEIVGSGPDEGYYRRSARGKDVEFRFHGYVSEKKISEILGKCLIGVAPYIPEDSNVSRFGDPAKVKRYLELGLPIIITPVFEFSKELEKSGAGLVVNYGDAEAFSNAVKKIINNYSTFVKRARNLQKKYYYKDVYKRLF